MENELVGRHIPLTAMESVILKGKGVVDLVCPNCHDYLVVTYTSYGWYAICRRDQVRWTHIRGDDGIVAERWHPMNEREMLTGLTLRCNPVELS